MHLADRELEWLFRPVGAGWCLMESLKDGTLDLDDIALMNDMIDIQNENNYRVSKAMNRG